MNARKSLFAAMLAAGIIAGDALPEAQSTVFVPELAMLDGALCVTPAAGGPAAPLLVAQAAKTEVAEMDDFLTTWAPVDAPALLGGLSTCVTIYDIVAYASADCTACIQGL